MYINKKIDIRGSFTHLINESTKNNLNKKGKHCLNNSLSMNNIYLFPPTSRQFGKEVKNLINLTVNSNYLIKESIDKKILYYRKINDDLTNMLNNYDKNFFNENNRLSKRIKSININKENSGINFILTKKCRNKSSKSIKIGNKENKDNNISYIENLHEENNEEKNMEKTMNINIINKDNNIICINEKNNNIEKNKKIKTDKKEIINLKKNVQDNLILKNNNNLKTNGMIANNININNPQEINEYFEEIFFDMQLRENSTLIDPNYLKNTQKFINRKMRAILIDWLIEVHKKYKLKPETMFLTVSIIDRYLSKKKCYYYKSPISWSCSSFNCF